jgi:hypothetical protein
VEPDQAVKTLLAEIGGAMAGDRTTSLWPLAGPWVPEPASAYVVGGIAPRGQRQPQAAALDASLLEWPSGYVSGVGEGSIQPEQSLITVIEALTASLTH